MKNMVKLIGLIALAAIISFSALSLTGCGDGSGGGDPGGDGTHTHQWGEWAQTTAPTETDEGEETRTCTLNNTHKETRPVATLNHTHQWGNWTQTTVPTCTAAGEEKRICSLNNTHYETNPVTALGHDWGNWSEPTPKAGVETRKCTHDATHTETRVVVAMVSVSGGNFQMGSASGSVNQRPVHTVTLTSGFYIGKYEVTQSQWQTVMGSLPSSLQSDYYSRGKGDNYPVHYTSWYDALVFCNKLSISEGLTPAYRINNSTDPTAWGTVPTDNNATWDAVTIVSGSTGYRLPTEAQWEYAAKGGQNMSNPPKIYSGSDTVNDVAWYDGNNGSNGTTTYGTKQVGTKSANELGLHDMSGNVSEWCWDWVASYSSESQTDPMGPSSGSYRVSRGGYWNSSVNLVSSTSRGYTFQYSRYDDIGFRLVRPAQ